MRYLLSLFVLLSVLEAHKINLFVSENNGSLEIYSYFANGNACKGCKLIIKEGEQTLLEDYLDSKGEYRYQPNTKKLDITVDASSGHIAQESVEVSHIKHEDIQTHKAVETKQEHYKIVLGLALIFGIFFILKRFKR